MKYNFHEKRFEDSDIRSSKTAIAGSDSDISWKALKHEVIELSAQLLHIGLPHNCPVIIYGHKESVFPLAMLACFHSNIPYIPIDKIYPEERIKTIIKATGAQVLINCSENKLNIDFAITFNSKLELKKNYNPVFEQVPDDNSTESLAYIMFTSGSTGEPKGVRIIQKSILSFIDWASKDFGFNCNDVFMNQAPFTFDVSLCDILNAFSLGATLVLNSSDLVKTPEVFFARLSHYRCSVWTSTPSFVYLFLRHASFSRENLPAIKTFLFMGEDLPNKTCKQLKQLFKNTRILNAYGPTEATIVTTLIQITESIIENFSLLPIGYPMPESKIIIDKINPDDKMGELIIVGNHVSVGYFKNEELNKQKFFIHEGKRAFRTGDLAYYENGVLFCKGRNDDQVKMHGFRIELNEISKIICKNKFISEAITVGLKRNSEVKKIVSFVISKNNINNSELIENLNHFLKLNLPYYMIPGDIEIVREFPHNASHKIDKNKLIDDYLNRQLKL